MKSDLTLKQIKSPLARWQSEIYDFLTSLFTHILQMIENIIEDYIISTFIIGLYY